jgi:L-lactate dehydrogenase
VLQSGLTEELLLHDIRSEVAEGEVMDLVHGASFCPTAEVSVARVRCSTRRASDMQWAGG